MADPNSSFDELAAITIANYAPRLADNVTTHCPLLYYIKQSGGMQVVTDGGTQILENLRYSTNASFKWFSGYEELSVTPTDDFTVASYDWKECNANVIFSGRDLAINAGKAKQYDLIKGKTQSTEDTLINNIGAALFYSNTESSGKAIGGLQHLVADTPTSGTVGNIDRAAQTWWANQYYDFSSEGVVAGIPTIKSAMNTLYRNCQRNSDVPNLILMDSTYYGYYESALQAQAMFQSAKEADAGFMYLMYKNAKVIYDYNCPSAHGYFLNTKFIKYRPHADVNMKVGKPKYPTNQNATVIPVNFMGNMTLANASVQGVMHA